MDSSTTFPSDLLWEGGLRINLGLWQLGKPSISLVLPFAPCLVTLILVDAPKVRVTPNDLGNPWGISSGSMLMLVFI